MYVVCILLMYVLMYGCMHVCVVCMYAALQDHVCMYVCVCVCMYVYHVHVCGIFMCCSKRLFKFKIGAYSQKKIMYTRSWKQF
jgi:hypothetical protein